MKCISFVIDMIIVLFKKSSLGEGAKKIGIAWIWGVEKGSTEGIGRTK